MSHGDSTGYFRHVGDLGNIVADANGDAVIDATYAGVSLIGRDSIVGRAFVVHVGQDDLGKGGDDGSRATGNAGSHFTCGVVFLM